MFGAVSHQLNMDALTRNLSEFVTGSFPKTKTFSKGWPNLSNASDNGTASHGEPEHNVCLHGRLSDQGSSFASDGNHKGTG